jgi:hypothetical protein
MKYAPELFAADLACLLDHVGWQRAVIAASVHAAPPKPPNLFTADVAG